jgi:hypothetical protein
MKKALKKVVEAGLLEMGGMVGFKSRDMMGRVGCL